MELEPNTREHWNLKGNVHNLFGEYAEAIEAYTRALSIDPDYGEAAFNRGLAYMMSYRPLQGCEDLRYSMDRNYERATEAYNNYCGY